MDDFNDEQKRNAADSQNDQPVNLEACYGVFNEAVSEILAAKNSSSFDNHLANYLLSDITAVALEVKRGNKTPAQFSETLAGLLLDPVLFVPIDNPVLLSSGHTVDGGSYDDLAKGGLGNPFTRGQLHWDYDARQKNSSQGSNQATSEVIKAFKAFLANVANLPAEEENSLPAWLQELIDNFPYYDPQKQKVRRKGGAGSIVSSSVPQDSEAFRNEWRDLAGRLANSLRARGLLLTHSSSRRSFPLTQNLGLFFLFASGAVLTSVGLSPFVQGLKGYEAFMAFVAAHGTLGTVLAGVVLGVGILIIFGVLAFLFWPRSRPASEELIPEVAHYEPIPGLGLGQAQFMARLLNARRTNEGNCVQLVASARQHRQSLQSQQQDAAADPCPHPLLSEWTISWLVGLFKLANEGVRYYEQEIAGEQREVQRVQQDRVDSSALQPLVATAHSSSHSGRQNSRQGHEQQQGRQLLVAMHN